MNPVSLLLIALGGALGSVLRAVLSWLLPAGRLPWPTMAVNVLGSFLIGWLMVKLAPTDARHLQWHGFAVVGFCGGFTTFSAFSWQAFDQVQKGNWPAALANALMSVTLCIVATWLGWRLAR